MNTDYNSKMEIELLKKDVVSISSLCQKFDATIDKMQEIAVNLSKIVSLHEQRLEIQEKASSELQSVLEMRRIEHNNDIKELHSRITTVNRELSDKIEETEKAILKELHDLREELKDDKSNTGSRLSQVETWKYTVIGVILVVVWLLSNLDVLKIIFNR